MIAAADNNKRELYEDYDDEDIEPEYYPDEQLTAHQEEESQEVAVIREPSFCS